jgi:hypothetical protein
VGWMKGEVGWYEGEVGWYEGEYGQNEGEVGSCDSCSRSITAAGAALGSLAAIGGSAAHGRQLGGDRGGARQRGGDRRLGGARQLSLLGVGCGEHHVGVDWRNRIIGWRLASSRAMSGHPRSCFEVLTGRISGLALPIHQGSGNGRSYGCFGQFVVKKADGALGTHHQIICTSALCSSSEALTRAAYAASDCFMFWAYTRSR